MSSYPFAKISFTTFSAHRIFIAGFFTIFSVFVLYQLYFQAVTVEIALMISFALIMGTGVFVFGLFQSVKPAKIVDEIDQLSQWEKILLQVMRRIASSKELRIEEKKIIFEQYFEELRSIHHGRCDWHLKQANFDSDARMILDGMLRQLGSKAKEMIDQNGGHMPYAQIDFSNQVSNAYERMLEVMQASIRDDPRKDGVVNDS